MNKRMRVMKWTTLTCLMGTCVVLNVWLLYHERAPFTMVPVPSLVAMLIALMYHDLYRDSHTTLDDAVFYSLIAVAQVTG
uniref:Uncharacterized protein n=1 Tax=Timema poppense TaxID=170557 RepID=A0A7R9HG53_TIMPO|nr:unnamed protein product [Timema poppensis]